MKRTPLERTARLTRSSPLPRGETPEFFTLQFFGERWPVDAPPAEPSVLPAGTYRVICGDLYRILPGAPASPGSAHPGAPTA